MSTREEVAMWTNLTEPRIRVRTFFRIFLMKKMDYLEWDFLFFSSHFCRFGSRIVELSGASENGMQRLMSRMDSRVNWTGCFILPLKKQLLFTQVVHRTTIGRPKLLVRWIHEDSGRVSVTLSQIIWHQVRVCPVSIPNPLTLHLPVWMDHL